MTRRGYRSMDSRWDLKRREFLKLGAIASAGIVLGRPSFAEEQAPPPRTKTNIDEVKDLPRTAT